MKEERKAFDQEGRELNDPTPISVPVRFTTPESEVDRLRRFLRSEQLSRELDAQGFDTAEEADDFDVGDDYDPTSPYEEVFDVPDEVFLPLSERARASGPDDGPEDRKAKAGGSQELDVEDAAKASDKTSDAPAS